VLEAARGTGVIGRREMNRNSVNFKDITKEQEINWLYYRKLKAFAFCTIIFLAK